MTAIAIEGIANQQHDFFLKPSSQQLLNLESDLDQISQPNDLIAINSGDVPTPMYFAHRKGWILKTEDLNQEGRLKALWEKGLRYVVLINDRFTSGDSNNHLILIRESLNYSIYSVQFIH